jgi:pimeloyl-ACP methyl ester carboxylesterase
LEGLHTRSYGSSGPLVIVLHGGPGARGEAAPIARGLADSFRVLEPWQRGSGEEPLSVDRHIADLHGLIESRGPADRPAPALVGESWGAMLALAYAAAYPASAGPIVLVGCGTFDEAARGRLRATLDERMDEGLRRRLEQLPEEFPDPAERLRRTYELTRPLYVVDPMDSTEAGETTAAQAEPLDVRSHTETWEDMVRLQREGVYPARFAAIRSPVLMLHGAQDPHPGWMIRASLEPYLERLEYREWDRCGHSPWLERGVREEFFALLKQWLGEQMVAAQDGS